MSSRLLDESGYGEGTLDESGYASSSDGAAQGRCPELLGRRGGAPSTSDGAAGKGGAPNLTSPATGRA